jgi:hypothetical protein
MSDYGMDNIIPEGLQEWLDDQRARDIGEWEAQQSAEHQQRVLQEQTDNDL